MFNWFLAVFGVLMSSQWTTVLSYDIHKNKAASVNFRHVEKLHKIFSGQYF